MFDIDRAVIEVAVRQHGVISVRQCTELGMTRGMRSRRVQRGHLVELGPDVLRLAGAVVTFEAKVLAAVLAAGAGAMATHRTAAALWRFDGFRPGLIEVAVPRGRWHRPIGVVVHQSSDLERCTRRFVAAIPVTDPGRTILDLARRTGDARLLGAMESARRDHGTSWASMVETLVGHARKGRPGVVRMRRVLAANIDRDEVTDSLFESLVLSLFAERGLPAPTLHHRVFGPDGRFVAEVDLAYPGLRVAIELDGQVHLQRAVFDRDRPRQNQLELLGWTVLRFTWTNFVDDPDGLVRQVRQALRQAAIRPA